MPTPSNFAFLASHDARLARMGLEAEQLATLSPNACMMQLRTLAELLARESAAYLNLGTTSSASFFDVLKALESEPSFHGEIREIFHELRQNANDVVHGKTYLADATGVALRYLRLTRRIAIWFHQSFGRDPEFRAGPFVDPPDLSEERDKVLRENENLRRSVDDIDRALKDAEAKAEAEKRHTAKMEELLHELREERNIYREMAEDYESRLADVQTSTRNEAPEALEEKRAQVSVASQQVTLDEQETRAIIDAQLRRAGWKADTQNLRWSQGFRPEEGTAQAIAEVPTSTGPADYVLYDGLTPVAVIEAKRRDQPVSQGVEQAKRYVRALADEGITIPFIFATNGREFHRQIDTHCGVWFQDLRRPVNQARALSGWYTPAGLQRLLKTDTEAALAKLQTEPFDSLGLRYYQREAIEAVEQAVAHGRRTALLAMATGTGKTRTAIGLMYRMLKSGLFNRILFLVDRTSLGDQAFGAMQNMRVEPTRPLTKIYDVKNLGERDIEPDTRLSIATVQSMVHRIFNPDESRRPAIDEFDCIIVDECHRGYNLDREMSDIELDHRDEADYVSKYRRVLDHFDAMIIGLTATPALHTTQIFNRPVYTYRYQTAVLDGFLVDQAPAIKVATRLASDGLQILPGQQLQFIDPKTGEVDFASTPDELTFEVDTFNRSVITEGFNEAVCRDLVTRIDPNEPGKTLIFCVTKDHADMVHRQLTEAYAEVGRPVTNGTIRVITGTSDRPAETLLRYKNEKKPSIAITVDYLSTGVDVPAIVNIVFLRRVRSRVLYEQMKGRATRLCDEIHKDAFRVFDYVDLYDALEEVTDMKPVVQQPQISIAQNVEELISTDSREFRGQAHRELVGKLTNKFRRLTPEGEDTFNAIAGMPPEAFLQTLRDQSPEDAAIWVADQRGVIAQLPTLATHQRSILYDTTPDEVVEVTIDAPDQGDYLREFETYIKSYLNRYEALQVVTQRPRELTRKTLQELRQQLAKEGYRTETLQKAWAQKTNHEIAASIIGFIRQAAIGEPLVPYEVRVTRALHTLEERHNFSSEQRHWLQRIGQNLIKDQNVADPANLDEAPAFRSRGGFERINSTYFDGQLKDLLAELNDQVWRVDEGA